MKRIQRASRRVLRIVALRNEGWSFGEINSMLDLPVKSQYVMRTAFAKAILMLYGV